MTTIGIDLGTTNSVVAVMDNDEPVIIDNAYGAKITPSVVLVEPEAQTVGLPAQRMIHDTPAFTFTSIKRILGREFNDPITQECVERAQYEITAAPNGAARVGGPLREHSPIEISAAILRDLRASAERYLDEEVTDAVIAVPAYFNDHQRKATKEAGKMAGFKSVRLINEPTAAALAYKFRADDKKERTVAVYDLGGGTFDISILKVGGGEYEVLATNGDPFLGGDDFDAAVIEYLVDGFNTEFNVDLRQIRPSMVRLAEAVESAKRFLSGLDSRMIRVNSAAISRTDGSRIDFEYVLKREELESLTAHLVERTLEPCRRAMADAHLEAHQIDEVLLVGGMTRMPAVRAAVETFFGKKPTKKGIDADQIVAAGAAVFGAVLAGDVDGLTLHDIAPHGLGIELSGKRFMAIIPPGTPIPTRETKRIKAAKAGQNAVTVRVQEGNSADARENLSLAQAHIENMPLRSNGERPAVDVIFEIDADGCVNVDAKHVGSGLAAKTMRIS